MKLLIAKIILQIPKVVIPVGVVAAIVWLLISAFGLITTLAILGAVVVILAGLFVGVWLYEWANLYVNNHKK